MHARQKHFFLGLAILGIGAVVYMFWPKQSNSGKQQARTSVQTVKTGLAEKKSIPITIHANGYVVAFNTVEVRPQTQNIVRGVHVREGQDVRAGQLLFTLDQRTDISNVERSQAQVASDRAELIEAEAAYKRNQELFAKRFVSQAVVDTARARVEALRGNLQANQAAVKSSSVALSNNKITASISGRLGAINVHPGSLAQPGGMPMVIISQIDPIAVSFSVPERELGHIMANYRGGGAPVVAELSGGQELEGKLFFIDNAADAQSGTIRMKAQFNNTDRRLWPGTFVNVRMVARTLPDAVAIPSQAIVTGPDERFVYVVQPDNTVRKQKVEVLTVEDGQAAVGGLAAGARVVVEGTQNLRPNSKVKEADAAPPAESEKKSAAA
ncbi:efflux RND transporter periplasmic adaptor subunit [Oxalobacteraceae bacterium R-40]|uniref:Efflux RND transporter periplasmic adaptor subunit n=1 Tax=Keguizhuia sedimenti TaxID=3064264 RepID=A0ABU1BL64_9BURK|nr:efflux RND transporter periplasmic adaptor subunit [Oxalobacteraceae bacterium R-40]